MGGGKSTLAKTIAGLVKYNKGEIIWGNDRNETIRFIKMSYIYSRTEIFSGSIQENILMGKAFVTNYYSMKLLRYVELVK